MSKSGFAAFFAQFPTLQAGNVTLRETTLSDAHDIYTLFSNPQVVAYYDIEPHLISFSLLRSDHDGQMQRK